MTHFGSSRPLAFVLLAWAGAACSTPLASTETKPLEYSVLGPVEVHKMRLYGLKPVLDQRLPVDLVSHERLASSSSASEVVEGELHHLPHDFRLGVVDLFDAWYESLEIYLVYRETDQGIELFGCGGVWSTDVDVGHGVGWVSAYRSRIEVAPDPSGRSISGTVAGSFVVRSQVIRLDAPVAFTMKAQPGAGTRTPEEVVGEATWFR